MTNEDRKATSSRNLIPPAAISDGNKKGRPKAKEFESDKKNIANHDLCQRGRHHVSEVLFKRLRNLWVDVILLRKRPQAALQLQDLTVSQYFKEPKSPGFMGSSTPTPAAVV
jgi:hypothetical protein